MSDNSEFNSLLIFRTSVNDLTVYIPEENYRAYKIQDDFISKVPSILPKTFRIDAEIALPDSIPIQKLVKNSNEGNTSFELLERDEKIRIFDLLNKLANTPRPERNFPVTDSDPFEKVVSSLVSALKESNLNQDEETRREKQLELAKKLIYKIAQVDPEVLSNLAEAIKKGKQGYANGIIKMINDQLATNLNFPNWWVQDRNFQLKVMAREHDLVFTITDKTGTEYSFKERSSGLKYFLSYYIQYRSHESHKLKNEILLMDEPDTYLSSQAQQDLLRIFEAFANPEEGSHIIRPVQVVYVTHSPFLVDKNHAERIRVLQKGNEDEGTRVVKDAAKNHYEPLRSAFGAFVGETTFIGNCNLMVEGIADQILLAGASNYLRRKRGISTLEKLNLNNLTIVPAGSASHIPYLVYLARGRDIEQPAVIVLLDSDSSGNDAKKHLLGKGGRHRKPLIKESFIVQIGDLFKQRELSEGTKLKPIEIEDLIPLEICVLAARHYALEMCNIDESTAALINKELISSKLTEDKTVFDALQACFENLSSSKLHIEKVGFARNVVQILNELYKNPRDPLAKVSEGAMQELEENFKTLFQHLNKMQRQAQNKLIKARLSQQIKNRIDGFIQQHRVISRRENALILLQDIESLMDENRNESSPIELDKIKEAIQNIRHSYNLDQGMTKYIDDYEGFKLSLEQIRYAGLLAIQEDELEPEQILDLSIDSANTTKQEQLEVETSSHINDSEPMKISEESKPRSQNKIGKKV
ncbi:ATP-dependent endonuclease [Trichocoleus sp. FACHB-262]|uniref:ATP-dependent nuclease n=1 Tax=Trichocoleus sp. FACHB-262 TaxID=2692869 RepID=UPI001682FEDD|nr:AAA family ATPase [Trichocoleus sp. FACHB-262]MBD2122166.1 AAA family ATPase [Trichocoleus sp. FACHB-262]